MKAAGAPVAGWLLVVFVLTGAMLHAAESIEISGTSANVTFSGAGDPGPITISPTLPDTLTLLDAAAVNAALNNGSNVTIDTASVGTTTAGVVTITSALLKSADGGSTDGSILTLNADNNIVVNNTITSTAGQLDINFLAGRTSGGFLDINAAVTTKGGDFVVSGSYFDSTGGTITTGGGLVNVTTTSASLSTIGATLDAGSGSVTFSTVGNLAQAFGIGVTGSGVSYTVAGAGNMLAVLGSVTAPAGDIDLVSAGPILLNGAFATTDGSILVHADSDGTVGADMVNMFGGSIAVGGAGRSVTLQAPDVSLGGTVSGQNVNLYPSTAGRNMTIGNAVAGTYALDDAEMNRITVPSGGTLTIGSDALNQTGTITMHSLSSRAGAALARIDGGIVINAAGAGGTVVFTGGYMHTSITASPTLSVNTRTVAVNGNVSQKGDLTWSADAINVSGSRTVASAAGSLTFQANGAGLTLQAGTDALDAVNLTAAGSVTVNGSITAPETSSNVLTIAGPGGVNLGAVGAPGRELGSLVVGTSGTTVLSGDVYTNTLQDYTGSGANGVRINGTVRLDSGAGPFGSINLAATPITRTTATDSLTLAYGAAGTLSLDGIGAPGAELAAIAIDSTNGATGPATVAGSLYAHAIDLHAPGANGITITNAVRLDADSGPGDIDLRGVRILGGGSGSLTLDVDPASRIYLGTVIGLRTLTIDGSSGPAGPLILTGDLWTGGIDFRGCGANGVHITGSRHLYATEGPGGIDLRGTPIFAASGNDSLTLKAGWNETITLAGVGTDAQPLRRLGIDVMSPAVVLTGDVYADGQSYVDAASLRIDGAVRLDGDGGGGALYLGPHTIARTQATDTLTLDVDPASVIVMGGVGSAGAEFAAFTIDDTSGTTGHVMLWGDVYANAIDLRGPGANGIEVSGNHRFDADSGPGDINLQGTPLLRSDARDTLTFAVDPASATILGPVGSQDAPFASLTIAPGSGRTRLTGSIYANAMDFTGSGINGVQVSGAAIRLDACAGTGSINFTGTPITAAAAGATTLTLQGHYPSQTVLAQVGTDTTPLRTLGAGPHIGCVTLTGNVHANTIDFRLADELHIDAGGIIVLDADGGPGDIDLCYTRITAETRGVDGLVLSTQPGDNIYLHYVQLASLTVTAGSGPLAVGYGVDAYTQTYGGDVMTADGAFFTGNAVFHKRLLPGVEGILWDMPGALYWYGDLTLASTATLVMQICGIGLGWSDGHDMIELYGTAYLDGVLDLDLGDFSPAAGQQFVLIQSLTGEVVDAGLRLAPEDEAMWRVLFTTSNGNSALVVERIPEPCTLGLLGVGTAVLALRRRRRGR